VKRVLVLAYYFPPLGGAGVQRTVKLLKHLPALGYQASVVTGPEATRLDWAPPDESLSHELPAGTVVRRARGPEPPRWSGRGARWLARPSAFSHWWVEAAVAAGRELVADADLVYASMSPFETAEAAARLAREAGVPWVADLRDPWALDDWAVFPTALHRRVEERRMRQALGAADAVVMNTPEAEREVRRRFPELGSRLATVPNGWDQEDFAGLAPARRDDAFRIVHVGYLHHRPAGPVWSARLRGLTRGGLPGLDTITRSHVYLLEALRRLRAVEPELSSRLELHLAGPERAPVEPEDAAIVHDHGYLAHADAVALVRSADLLFLPMHDLPEGVRTRTVPGKTYEYLASGRPILAALPDGDARDLLLPLEHVAVCRPKDIEGMVDAIRAAARNPAPADLGRPAVALEFERHRLSERLASVFDGLVTPERRPAVVK
jgi:glycosyltransferase involved in cell wall biosynthesis